MYLNSKIVLIIIVLYQFSFTICNAKIGKPRKWKPNATSQSDGNHCTLETDAPRKPMALKSTDINSMMCPDSNGRVNVKHNSNFKLSCESSKFESPAAVRVTKEVNVKCKPGNTLEYRGRQYRYEEFKCNKPPESKLKVTNKKCGRAKLDKFTRRTSVISVYENTQKLGAELAKNLSELANDVLAEGGNVVFKIGLSGGSVVSLLSEYLAKVETDWTKWRFFFCDERLVEFNDPESTFGQYRDKFISNLPITEDQFIKINPQLSVDEAAKDYIQKMSVYFAPYDLPRFDALILGVGPDGHTCSLFPGHKLCEETSVWVAPISDSPKPPPNRITFTFPILNNARYCAFIATGSSKADILKRILKDNEQLPANCVQPVNGSVQWLLDEPAAKLLQEETSL